eukprot:gene5033-5692_t
MAVIRASKPTTTWGQYTSDQLKAFKPPSSWAVKQRSLPLLEKLGDEKSLNADGERDITNFIHRAIYNGKENGGIVTTRINQYDKLRVKTTRSIIPDPGSLNAKKSGKKKDVCKSASFSLMDTSETSDATDSDDGLTGKTVFTEHGICPDDKGDYDWLYLRSEEDCAAYDSDDDEYIP